MLEKDPYAPTYATARHFGSTIIVTETQNPKPQHVRTPETELKWKPKLERHWALEASLKVLNRLTATGIYIWLQQSAGTAATDPTVTPTSLSDNAAISNKGMITGPLLNPNNKPQSALSRQAFISRDFSWFLCKDLHESSPSQLGFS